MMKKSKAPWIFSGIFLVCFVLALFSFGIINVDESSEKQPVEAAADTVRYIESRIVPGIKSYGLSDSLVAVNLNIELADSLRNRYDNFFNWFKYGITQRKGVATKLEFVRWGDGSAATNDSTVKLANDEAYVIEHKKGNIKVFSKTDRGFLNALTTLKKLLQKGNGYLGIGKIRDWPDHKVRALHFVSTHLTEEEALTFINKAREKKFNTILIQLADGVKFESMQRLYRSNAWGKDFLQKFVRLASENGIEVIPELKLLSHQYKLFKSEYPELMYNRYTYDPSLQATKDKVFSILNEVIEVMEPKAVHIGHDEVFGIFIKGGGGSGRYLREGEEALPASLFLESVRSLHDFLRNKNIATWMWGDMLLDWKSFPDAYRLSMHGDKEYMALIDQMPQDIVICDYHYSETDKFPTTAYFAEQGFKVLGSTWKTPENITDYSKYVYRLPKNGAGMIETTWSLVRKNEWHKLEYMLSLSSEAFWNAK